MSNNNDNHHNTCAICLEPLSNGESTIGAVHPCGHVFHVPCWEGWVNSRQSKTTAKVKCVMCNKFSTGFCKLFLDLSDGLEGRRGDDDDDDDDADSLSSCSSSEHDESTSLNEEPTTAAAAEVAREEASALGEPAAEHPPDAEAVRVTQPAEDAASVDTSLRRQQVGRLLEANESSSTNDPSNQGTSSVMEEEQEDSSNNNNNADVIVIDGDDDMGDTVEKKEQQQRKKRKRRSSTRTESSTSNDSHSDDKDKLDKYKRLAKRYKRSNKMLQSQREQHSKIQESLTEELDDAKDELELQQERIDELEKQVDVSELRLSGAALQVVQLKNTKEEAEKKLASLRQQLDMISSEMEKMKASHRLDLEKSQTGGMAECQQILEKNKLLIKQRDAYKDRLVHAVEAVQQLETKLRSLGHSTTLLAPPAVKERAVSVSTTMAKTAKLFRQMEDHHHHPKGGVAAVRPEKPSIMQRMKPEEVDQCISKSSARAATISNAQKKQAPRTSLDVLDCLDRLPTASNLVQLQRKQHHPPSDSRKRAAMNASVKPRGLLPIHTTITTGSRPRPPAQPKKQLQRDIRSMFRQD